MGARRSYVSYFRRKLIWFHVTQDRIVSAVFLLICLVAVYLLVMSFILLSEVHNRFSHQSEKKLSKSRSVDSGFQHVEREARKIKRGINVTDSDPTSRYNERDAFIAAQLAIPSYTTEPPEELYEDVPLKTILFWNPFFSDWEYHFGLGRRPFLKHRCPINTCRTVNNATFVSEADAVVFHTPLIGDKPDIRPGEQKYVFLQREPHYPKSKQLLYTYQDMFNLTMTYRYDSDIPIPYGRVVPRTNSSERYNEYPPDTKTAQVVWVVSHCNSLGRREMYMEELQKHVRVDIYGDCGNLTCEKSDNKACHHRFETKYRFYVAFENTYCLDYVSEKLYRSLQFDMIPLVYGKANYSALAPPHSVIDILDFPTPKSLAEYLWYLTENPEQYSRYFVWKRSLDVVFSRELMFAPAFCKLCEVLHDPFYEYKDYRNISTWWLGEGTCELGFMAKFRKNNHW